MDNELKEMPELGRCPFCDEDDLELEEKLHEYFWICQNPDCIACGPWASDENGATAKWKTRPIEDKLRAEVERLRVVLKDAGDLLADEDANDQYRLEFAGFIDAVLKGGE